MNWLSQEPAEVKSHIEDEYRYQFANDPENRSFWAEVMRAKWVLYTHRANPDKMAVLSQYGVLTSVITHLLGEEPAPPQPKEKRADKYNKLVDWCKENHLYQASANEIAEVGDLSYPTALKFIKDRPDLFFRIKKGVYEVRNPEIMRAEENT